MAKLSFKISWIDEEEKFLVKQMSDNVVEEECKFDSHLAAMAKLSFKVSWLQDEEKFMVKQMSDGVVKEEHKFDYHLDAMEYISDTMAMCLTCQEDWSLTY